MQGSHELASFLNLDFWTRTVFEQSHQESTVRQALVSLSSLHLDFTTASRSSTASHETLNQYGKALRMLQRRMRTPNGDSTRAGLICSIIFYCFEATLGNNQAATAHLQGGLNLLSSLHQTDTPSPDLDSVTLEFERLDLQAVLFYDQPVPFLNLPDSLHPPSTPTPSRFHRLSDAHRSMVTLMHRGWTLISDNLDHKHKPLPEIPLHILLAKQTIHTDLQAWKSHFDDLQTRLNETDAKAYGAQILLIHYHLSTILLDGVFPANADTWGATPNPRAARLLSLIEDILAGGLSTSSNTTSSPTPQRTVSSEMGVVAPLFALALKCADPEVCDRAYYLLRSTRRREGLWDAEHMGGLVGKLREVREGMAGEEMRGVSLEVLFGREFDVPVEVGRDLSSSSFEEVVVGLYGAFRPGG